MKIEGKTLPTRLTKQPIIDAVAEIRFTSAVDASLVLPGMLLQTYPGARVERLPAADMPDVIKQMDENLRHQPSIRVFIDQYFFLIGSSSISVCCILPYRGWNDFKAVILSVFDVVQASGFASSVTRAALKYADVLPVDSVAESFKYLDLCIGVAGELNQHDAFHFQIQNSEDSVHHTVQAAAPAHLAIWDGSKRKGALISIDTVIQKTDQPIVDFWKNASEIYDGLHKKNKEKFFSCLTEEALPFLGAEYV